VQRASMQLQAGLKGQVVPCCLPSPPHHRGEGMKSCRGRGQRRCRRRLASERRRRRRRRVEVDRLEPARERHRQCGPLVPGTSFTVGATQTQTSRRPYWGQPGRREMGREDEPWGVLSRYSHPIYMGRNGVGGHCRTRGQWYLEEQKNGLLILL